MQPCEALPLPSAPLQLTWELSPSKWSQSVSATGKVLHAADLQSLTQALQAQMKAEKPAWHLGVGTLLHTLGSVAAASADHQGYMEKGELPPARLTLTRFTHSFVLDGAHPCFTLHVHYAGRDGSQ